MMATYGPVTNANMEPGGHRAGTRITGGMAEKLQETLNLYGGGSIVCRGVVWLNYAGLDHDLMKRAVELFYEAELYSWGDTDLVPHIVYDLPELP